jgi:hypothetical protein
MRIFFDSNFRFGAAAIFFEVPGMALSYVITKCVTDCILLPGTDDWAGHVDDDVILECH